MLPCASDRRNYKMDYKGFQIETGYRLTSQAPGQGHSVAQGLSSCAKLSTVLAYLNQKVVDRIEFELGLSEKDAAEVFNDLKKFLWMASTSSQPSVPSPRIDKAWHEFLMFTEDYQEFCRTMFGSFLHHIPHTGKNDAGAEATFPTIDLALTKFGTKPSPNWDYVT